MKIAHRIRNGRRKSPGSNSRFGAAAELEPNSVTTSPSCERKKAPHLLMASPLRVLLNVARPWKGAPKKRTPGQGRTGRSFLRCRSPGAVGETASWENRSHCGHGYLLVKIMLAMLSEV